MTTPIIIIVALLALLVVLLVLGKIRRPAFFTLGGLIVLVGVLVIVKFSQFAAMGAMQYAPPPDTVTTASVTETTWQPFLSSVGSLSAVQGVTVAAQLDGNVAKIAFEAGSTVKAGDLLVQQDTSSEEAQLHAAEAAAELARLNVGRSRQLLSDATISQSQYDTEDAGSKQAEAQAATIRASIAKKTIRAPFSGRLGVRLVNLGQTLKAGDPIVSLQALDPIYADFYLPQQDLALIAQGSPVRISGESVPGGEAAGQITAINPSVDSDTRNVRAEATIANPQEGLHPGMFVHVNVLLPEQQKVLIIPIDLHPLRALWQLGLRPGRDQGRGDRQDDEDRAPAVRPPGRGPGRRRRRAGRPEGRGRGGLLGALQAPQWRGGGREQRLRAAGADRPEAG